MLAPSTSQSVICKDTPFVDIVRVLEKHYNPKPLEIAQSFHFGTQKQKSGESVGDYLLALKRLAVHYNYGEFLDRALSRCFKIGHLASICRSKSERKKGTVHNLHVSESSDDELGIYSLYSLDTNRPSPGGYSVEMLINGKPCKLEVDTAADYSIMAHSVYLEKFADTPLTPSKVVLRTYTGEVLEVSGEMQCNVIYKDKHYSLPVVVVNYSAKPTLPGKNWLSQIKLAWGEVLSVAYITMKSNVKPVFVKARQVPYALKVQVEKELDKLETHGVIKKTYKSSWASPVVVVPKSDNTVRICLEYKATINQSAEDEPYVLPTTQDLYTALVGSKVFSKLDLSHSYAQLNVDKESQEYLTIRYSTHRGLYSYLKLPYGVDSSPKIFQAKTDQILQGIEKCVCKQDDSLVGRNDWQENLKIIAEVLDRLHKYNLHLKVSKCEFLKPEVVYLGLKISAVGREKWKRKSMH